jgi:hypothetical protein
MEFVYIISSAMDWNQNMMFWLGKKTGRDMQLLFLFLISEENILRKWAQGVHHSNTIRSSIYKSTEVNESTADPLNRHAIT